MVNGGDVIAELTTDHREVEDLFEKCKEVPPGAPARRDLVDRVTMELVRHSMAEEEHLYPAVREHLANGDALADKEIADHAKVEEILKDLEGRSPDDASFEQLLLKLESEVAEHVRDEEERLFPLLRQACSTDQLMQLGQLVRAAKETAPTRPHPSAPDKPPLNKLLAPGVGLVDRIRDAITGRGKA
ncbi:hemerythrin domain-containing protein [Streptomyces sp. 7N604]|uniref:hemerythrin domain-containing protein n=1 Tax=Streptomyces sp. 7N604 TaxID=3457415 RepID=UPI003FD1E479